MYVTYKLNVIIQEWRTHVANIFYTVKQTCILRRYLIFNVELR